VKRQRSAGAGTFHGWCRCRVPSPFAYQLRLQQRLMHILLRPAHPPGKIRFDLRGGPLKFVCCFFFAVTARRADRTCRTQVFQHSDVGKLRVVAICGSRARSALWGPDAFETVGKNELFRRVEHAGLPQGVIDDASPDTGVYLYGLACVQWRMHSVLDECSSDIRAMRIAASRRRPRMQSVRFLEYHVVESVFFCWASCITNARGCRSRLCL
jgi:hypothetical protein